MKKLYTGIGSLLLCGSLFAQNSLDQLNSFSDFQSIKKNNSLRSGFEFDTLYYEDFSDSLLTGWTLELSDGPNGWQHTKSGSAGEYRGGKQLNSTSSENGYLIMDGDKHNLGLNPYQSINASVQSPYIDLTNHPNVILEFEDYKAYCCDLSVGELSLIIGHGSQFKTFTAEDVEINAYSENALKRHMNISELVGGQDSVFIKFHWDNYSHYWWMIDDVTLFSAPENDLVFNEVFYYPTDTANQTPIYNKIPLTQAASWTIDFTGFNDGSATQSDVKMDLSVYVDNTLDHNEQSAPLSQLNSMDTSEFALSYDFTQIGKHDFFVELISDSVDQLPNNNKKQFSIEITDTIYARDNNEFAFGFNPMAFGYDNKTEAGNIYDFIENDTVTSFTIMLDSSSIIGSKIRVKLYEYDGTNATLKALSITYELTENDLYPNMLTLPLATPFPAEAGLSYLATIEDAEGGNNNIKIALDKGNPSWAYKTVWYLDTDNVPEGWYWFNSNAAFIRINLGEVPKVSTPPVTGISEMNTDELKVYPSPNNGTFNIEFESNSNENYLLKIINTNGQEVIQKSISSNCNCKQIQTIHLPKGIYFVNLMSESYTTFQKVIVQ